MMLLVFSLLTKMSPVSLVDPAEGAAARRMATSGADNKLEMRTSDYSLHLRRLANESCDPEGSFPKQNPLHLGLDLARCEVLFLDGENLAGLDFDIAD